MMRLIENSYGKGSVRISKIVRHETHHDYINYHVEVTLKGDLETAYTDGDNSLVLPTDTIKNTVYAIADQHHFESPERFATLLADRYLATAPQMSGVSIKIDEHRWHRVELDGKPHPIAFTGSDSERRTVMLRRERGGQDRIESGLRGLLLLKTGESGFVGFYKDEYTILPEENDRIMATSVTAHWLTSGSAEDRNTRWAEVRETLIRTFATHVSPSVQATLYEMGGAVLERFPEIEEIYLSMPNVHNIPFNLSTIGLENSNSIFVPIDEPHGMIEGRMRRE